MLLKKALMAVIWNHRTILVQSALADRPSPPVPLPVASRTSVARRPSPPSPVARPGEIVRDTRREGVSGRQGVSGPAFVLPVRPHAHGGTHPHHPPPHPHHPRHHPPPHPHLSGAAGMAPAVLSWPLPGCRPDSLAELFSARTLAQLARVAGAADGAVALDLGGHTLQAQDGKPGRLQLLQGGVPPAGLRSLTMRNGTLALRPGVELWFSSTQPFAVSLEHIKLTRPPPSGAGGAGGKVALALGKGPNAMVTFAHAVSGTMVQCRVELCPAGPAGYSAFQTAVGVAAREGARVVLEDVDVVARQGAGSTQAVACLVNRAQMELNRCAGREGV
jgi:hypothetical protein